MDKDYFYKIILSAVIFNKEGKILLGRRSLTDDILPGYWGLPGGKIDSTEDTDDILEKELIREIIEEVGINVDILNLIENHLSAKSRKVNICFSAKFKSGIPQALDETDEVGWFSLEEIKVMQTTPYTFERIQKAFSSFLQEQ